MVARNLSDEIIKEKTGKTSNTWYKILDKLGETNHTKIAKFLKDVHKVNPWWAQILTNRYEWFRGLRNN